MAYLGIFVVSLMRKTGYKPPDLEVRNGILCSGVVA